MDAKARRSSPNPRPPRRENLVPPHARCQGLSADDGAVSGFSDPLPTAIPQTAQSPLCASEAREAKVRELQERLKSGTYRVSAEQIADKMLRDTLCEQLS
jgi:hypothetical protein